MVLIDHSKWPSWLARTVFFIGLVAACPVQAASFVQWVERCAPDAPTTVLAAIAQVSSHFDPLSVRLPDDIVHQKFERIEDAIKAADQLARAEQGEVRIGLFGLERSFLSDRGVTIDAAFDPCRSIALIADYLDRAPVIKGKPDYYGALLGLHPDEPEFVPAVLAVVKKGSVALNQATIGGDNAPGRAPHKTGETVAETVAARPDEPALPRTKWDVYGGATSRSVLIYSKKDDMP